MPDERKWTSNPELRGALKSSQDSVDLLENITAADLAQSVPFLRISRVNPLTRKPFDEPILNFEFQKPPQFGSTISEESRYGERPPVSLSSFTIETQQQFGEFVIQKIKLELTVHKPASLGDKKNRWMSIMTPLQSHVVEYGWTGTSKNPLINGEGVRDRNKSTFVDSINSILFTTNHYTFDISQDGKMNIVVHGWQNGNYMFERMYLSDKIQEHRDLNVAEVKSDSNTKVKRNAQKTLLKSENKKLRKDLQNNLKKLINSDKPLLYYIGKDGRKYANLIDVLNVLTYDTIKERANDWGFDTINLQLGAFNQKVSTLSQRKFKNKKVANIADFPVDLKNMNKFISTQTRNGVQITMKNFINNLIQETVNRAENFSPGKIKYNGMTLNEELPYVKIKVLGSLDDRRKNRILNVSIIDLKREFVQNFDGEELKPIEDKISRERVKKKLRERNIPFISMGKATSFIKDSSFEVLMDNEIQAILLDNAAKDLRTRIDQTSHNGAQLQNGLPDPQHVLWSSAMEGTITMMGNFVFDTFSYLWLDFGVDLWSGPFNVLNKTEVITPGSFITTLKVKSEGMDPLNTKKRLSEEEIKRKNEIAVARKDLARARSKRNKRDIKRAKERLRKLGEEVR